MVRISIVFKLDGAFGVGFFPGGGSGAGFVRPFAFECLDSVVCIHLDAVDLLLVVGAPEVVGHAFAAVGDAAAALVYEGIFPQGTAVGAEVEGLKLVDDCVADAVVDKIVAEFT